MTMILLFPCALWLDDGASVNRDSRFIALLLKTWPYLGPNFAIPNVPIRLPDLTKNNAVEFSIRMMQLTRF